MMVLVPWFYFATSDEPISQPLLSFALRTPGNLTGNGEPGKISYR